MTYAGGPGSNPSQVELWRLVTLKPLKLHTGCWGLIWPLKFLTSTKYTFLKLLGHEDSSGVCSFVQSHPYFFTIVRAFSFQLKLAYFPWISRIFKNMLLGRDGFGKKHVCHVILYTLRISKKYVISVLEILMVISFPRTLCSVTRIVQIHFEAGNFQ